MCSSDLAQGRLRNPSPTRVAFAWVMNPTATSEEEAIPTVSHTALARNTAGVQLPHAATAVMTASTPAAFNRAGNAATISRSSLPWMLPISRQPTKLMPE